MDWMGVQGYSERCLKWSGGEWWFIKESSQKYFEIGVDKGTNC